jgi:hypothetical protein
MIPYTIRDIPEELHNSFKAACAERGMSMKEAFLKLMREFVDKNKSKKD